MANEEAPKPDLPEVDIPNLKKQEKERKKAGAAWGQGGKGANAWEGAVGGSGQGGGALGAAGRAGAAAGRAGGAARSAAAAARAASQGAFEGAGFFARFFGRIAARLMGGGPVSQFFGRAAAALAQFATTALGQLALAAAAAMIVAGVGLAAGMLLSGRGTGQGALPDLGDIASSIRVRRGGDMSGLDMAKNNGLLNFGDKKPAATDAGAGAGKGGEGAGEGAGEAAAGEEAAGGLDNGNMMAAQKDRLAHDMSMAKLSSTLGGGSQSFGNRDIFGSGPRLGRGFSGQIRAAGRSGSASGRPISRAKVRAAASQRRGAMNRSRALGRLMQMSTLNRPMTRNTTGAEAASTLGSDQFEGQGTSGGAPPTGPTGPGGGGNPGGNPGSTPGGTPEIPDNPTIPGPETPTGACTVEGQIWDGQRCIDNPTPEGQNWANPWAGAVQGITNMINSAKSLLLVASVLYLAAVAWFATGCCAYIGAIIMSIVAVIMSIVITVMAQNIKRMADQIAGQDQQMLADGFKDIAGDLITGAWTAVAAGIGGFWFYGQVTSKVNEMQGQMDEALKPKEPQTTGPDYGPGEGSDNEA